MYSRRALISCLPAPFSILDRRSLEFSFAVPCEMFHCRSVVGLGRSHWLSTGRPLFFSSPLRLHTFLQRFNCDGKTAAPARSAGSDASNYWAINFPHPDFPWTNTKRATTVFPLATCPAPPPNAHRLHPLNPPPPTAERLCSPSIRDAPPCKNHKPSIPSSIEKCNSQASLSRG
jgi:hypothetical protein